MATRPEQYRINGVFNPVNLTIGCLQDYYKFLNQEKKQQKQQQQQQQISGLSVSNASSKRKFFQASGSDVMDRLAKFADMQKQKKSQGVKQKESISSEEQENSKEKKSDVNQEIEQEFSLFDQTDDSFQPDEF